MKSLFTLAIGLVASIGFSQTKLHQSFPINKGTELTLKFDYPQLVKVTTWEGNEIVIDGDVSINDGAYDHAFKLSKSSNSTQLTIEGTVEGIKDIPHKVIAFNGKNEVVFNSLEEFKTHQKNTNTTYQTTSMSVDMNIVLEVKVPKNIKTTIESVYGTVEVKDFQAPIVAKSTYGKVDAKIQPTQLGELSVETKYGKFYNDPNINVSISKYEAFHKLFTANFGQGYAQVFTSTYNNVYLRK
ncbi:hypothetical protein [Empedobacter stercoris]|uniref:hypothetical protein n=1 Tax=Empedobacter stercoris TaxID=1628248 RepID=UPI0039EB1ABD